jgi:hypothetical protein
MNSIGKAITTDKGWVFEKEFYQQQGYVYKYLGDLDLIDDDYPIYSSEFQENEYETKRTLKKLCEGSEVDWLVLFDMLEWTFAETMLFELEENMEETKND